jgi:hypothetical protein|tara:strand:+ start:32818 stop:32919 length:102 start_codon:yes stop_codon:yes gene_type:complete
MWNGIDNYDDGPWAFVVPAIVNVSGHKCKTNNK